MIFCLKKKDNPIPASIIGLQESAVSKIRNPITEVALEKKVAKAGFDYNDLKIKTTAKVALANDAKTYIDKTAQEVINQVPNTKLATAPIKSMERIIEKAAMEEGGSIDNIKDIARNTIIPFNEVARQKALELISKRSDLIRPPKIQTKDKFSGYEGIIVNVKAPNGLVSEIQIVTPQMTYGKNKAEFSKAVLGEDLFNKLKASGLEPGKGHEFYEQKRSLDESASDYLEQLKKIDVESVDYYAKLSNIEI